MQEGNSTLMTTDGGSESERSTLLIAYVLHALAPFTALTAIIAVIISHIKVKETQSAFIRSHHSWLIRTFWWGLLWSVICGVLTMLVVGLFGFVVLGIWWLYRTIRGFINYSEKRPMPG
mgnify:CR=1 FL=1